MSVFQCSIALIFFHIINTGKNVFILRKHEEFFVWLVACGVDVCISVRVCVCVCVRVQHVCLFLLGSVYTRVCNSTVSFS